MAGSAYALGLGAIRIQSGLGQQLRAQLDVSGSDAPEIDQVCFRSRVESPDGNLLAPGQVNLSYGAGQRVLLVTTNKNLQEPAVKIVVDVGCEIQLHREYLALLDPPQFRSLTQNPVTTSALTAPSVMPPVSEKPKKNRTAPVREKNKRSERAENLATEIDLPVTKEKKKPSKTPKREDRNHVISEAPKHDTLKLSDEVAILPAGLRLSESLSVSDGTAPANIAELRAAQAQFAAMMRDEKPLPSADKLKVDQQRILILQQETAQLKRQSQLDKAALEELKDNSFSRNWIVALSVFVAAGFALVLLLLLYIGRMHKRFAASWWQSDEIKPEPEAKRNIEELVNSVQASYGPTTTSNVTSPAQSETLQSRPAPAVRQSAPVTAKTTSDGDLGKLDSPSVFGRSLYSPTLEDTNSSTFNFFSSRGNSVKVEEISDVTQEAEFWMSVNDPDRAIEILEPQAEQEHPESPVPWLYLLDLYRVINNKEKYDALRDRFVVFFNANIPEFEVDPATIPSRNLEDFDHLMQKICKMWSGNDILPFLQSLLVDDRDGKRMGFELPVYRDILLLISIATELERLKTLGGENTSGWARASATDTQSSDHTPDEGLGVHSNMLNFEAIDFKNPK